MVVKPPKPKDPDSGAPLPSMPTPSMPTPSIPSPNNLSYKNKHPPINLNPPIPPIKKIEDKTKVNVRYPLISPYAYAHIYWNAKSSELVYDIEEPILNEQEKKLLRIIKNALQEIINISYLGEQSQEQILEYIAKAINLIAEELSLKIPESTYNKIFYYVYRDFIGLNEIEPLMRDYFIEDIECNGINSSVYVVHRLYRNIRTNLIFYSIDYLASLVEKLAQRCGKYISYANPLLDGTLPDGSRVNATYTTEITTRGPTFTIRKFTKIPWSPTQLIGFKTVSPEMLAYFWLLLQYKANILITGGTGSGKTSMLNALAFFIPPEARVVSIEDSVLGDAEIIYKKDGAFHRSTITELIDGLVKDKEKAENAEGIEIFAMDKDGKIKLFKPSCFLRHKVKKKILKIRLASGKEISVTADHSLFSLNEEGKIVPVAGKDLKVGSFVATPRLLPFEEKEVVFKISEYFDKLNCPDCFVVDASFVKDNRATLRRFLSKSGVRWCRQKGFVRASFFKALDGNLSNLNGKSIRSKYGTILPSEIAVDEDLAAFVGLWLADGSYDRNSVIISVVEEECRQIVKRVAERFGLKCKMHSDGISLMINSKLFKAFCQNVLGLKGDAYTKRLPEWVFNLSRKKLAALLRGYFSGDGWVRKFEVVVSSASLGLLRDIQTALLRFEIQLRIGEKLKDGTYQARISADSLDKFLEIGFLQQKKNERLAMLKRKSHDVSDVIPLPKHFYSIIGQFVKQKKQTWRIKNYVGKQSSNIGRRTLQELIQFIPNNPHGVLHSLAMNDVFWDKVVDIKEEEYEGFVYDISVPGVENFICQNIIAHNTREINLPRENWLPSVARTGLGGAEEIDLFTLLKESFRQRPDYVIVGEVRGREAYVLFQGMASGHASLSTIHADSVDAVIKRLQTPPISLSPTLLNILDVIAIMQHATVKGQETRKLAKVVEIVNIAEDGTATVNVPFYWSPADDKFYTKKEIYVFNKISERYGLSKEYLMNEFRLRTQLLFSLYKKGITDFFKVQKIINQYYKTPAQVIKEYL